ncbi:unnamed protein product [Blepharisma stoltei]|uniref:Dual specificity protein phosphatase n=1 Tax=Blepharisma stoltei TaxID=1481888 RepID=A0AAU9JLU6_9CILI|nr:unnamed protein product [Blepharisma stoltei]
MDQYQIGRAFNTPIHQISEFLYIGSRAGAEDRRYLFQLNIKHILVILPYYSKPPFPNDFNYLFIQLTDDPEEDLLSILPEALRFIHSAIVNHENVLVHCNAGVSRSGATVIAYLMASRHIHFEKALSIVQSIRPCVLPNEGFQMQLKSQSPFMLSQLI